MKVGKKKKHRKKLSKIIFIVYALIKFMPNKKNTTGKEANKRFHCYQGSSKQGF